MGGIRGKSISLLSILYYNARSVLPKMDDVAASVLARKPDVVCVSESWLGEDIVE